MTRRWLGLMPVIGVAILLLLMLRWRKEAFIAAQVRIVATADLVDAEMAGARLARIGRGADRGDWVLAAMVESDAP